MIGSSISTIVIFIPFLMMTGVAGAYFTVLTNTMVITLVCSFFVTWVGLPVIYLLLTRKPKLSSALKETKPKAGHVKKQRWVNFFILRPWVSILIMAAAIVAIVIVPSLLSTPRKSAGTVKRIV